MNLKVNLPNRKNIYLMRFYTLFLTTIFILYAFFKIGVFSSTQYFFSSVIKGNKLESIYGISQLNDIEDTAEDLITYTEKDIEDIESVSIVINKYKEGALTSVERDKYRENLFYDIGTVVNKDDLTKEVLLEIFYSPDPSKITKVEKYKVDFDISNTTFIFNSTSSSVFEQILDDTTYNEQGIIYDETSAGIILSDTCMFSENYVSDSNNSLMSKLFPCLKKGDILAVLIKDYSVSDNTVWEYVYNVN